jgi:hypothetical protein
VRPTTLRSSPASPDAYRSVASLAFFASAIPSRSNRVTKTTAHGIRAQAQILFLFPMQLEQMSWVVLVPSISTARQARPSDQTSK